MSFANLTWQWVAAGVAGLAAVLYLLQRLRVRHRPVVVPTTLFWNTIAQEAPARSLVERFRHPWAYALLLLICVLLWLAFAQPVPSRDGDATMHVAVLDGSAVMTADTRFDDAVARLRSHVRALPPARRHVLWCGAEVRTLLRAGEHELLLEKRLAALRPERAPSQVESLLRALAQEARPERPLEVTVISDVAFEAHADVDGASMRVVRSAGASSALSANHGVVALGMADAASGEWGYVDVYVEVSSNGTAAAPPALHVDIDGVPVPAERLQALALRNGSGWLLTRVPAAGGLLSARVPGGDAIPADDIAQLRLPHRAPIRVQLSPSLESLRFVLAADDAVELVQGGGEVAIRRDGEEFGPGLPALVFGPRDEHAAFTITHPEALDSREVLQEAVIAIGLRDVDATAIASTAAQPVEVAVVSGSQWRIELWEDLLSAEFNFTDSRPFPLFIANAVRWLARTPGLVPSVAAGRPFVRESPDNAAAPLTSSGRRYDPLGDAIIPARAGAFALDGAAQPHLVSLLDRATTWTSARAATAGGAAAPAGISHAAAWILLIVLVLLAVEWRLLQRGRIP
jgi:hypothetical protein